MGEAMSKRRKRPPDERIQAAKCPTCNMPPGGRYVSAQGLPVAFHYRRIQLARAMTGVTS
jgi:hypothetical protein